MSLDRTQVLDKARISLGLESDAIRATADALDDAFVSVVEAILQNVDAGRKLIFTGVGKNAFVCQKLAGTFNSTGVPACFLDPLQALHGDLGLCQAGDLVFLLSNSGETAEMMQLLPSLNRADVTTVAITAQAASALARACDRVLTYVVAKEACPLDLAPTASTTAALALGDALAMVCLDLREVTRDTFARFHPAGTLGMSLILRVNDVMRTGERFAAVAQGTVIREVVIEITRAQCGCAAIVSTDGTLAGVFTDGDLRRRLAGNEGSKLLDLPVDDYMTRNPIAVQQDALAADALLIFEKHNINDLIVVDKTNRPVGILDGQDLPKLKIV